MEAFFALVGSVDVRPACVGAFVIEAESVHQMPDMRWAYGVLLRDIDPRLLTHGRIFDDRVVIG